MWCSVVRCSAVQCGAVRWRAMQCGAVRCSAVQSSAVELVMTGVTRQPAGPAILAYSPTALHTAHFTLHTAHSQCTLDTTHCTLYKKSHLASMGSTVNTTAATYRKLSLACAAEGSTVLFHTVHCTLYTAHYTLHTVHYTLYTAHCTLHTASCTLHTSHTKLNSKLCCPVQYTLNMGRYILDFTKKVAVCL